MPRLSADGRPSARHPARRSMTDRRRRRGGGTDFKANSPVPTVRLSVCVCVRVCARIVYTVQRLWELAAATGGGGGGDDGRGDDDVGDGATAAARRRRSLLQYCRPPRPRTPSHRSRYPPPPHTPAPATGRGRISYYCLCLSRPRAHNCVHPHDESLPRPTFYGHSW